MKHRYALVTLLAGLLTLTASTRLWAAPSSGVARYHVVWDTPSADHHGSMPLGNGDIALNAWMPSNGDLQFYISKTDAWDDNARLLKVGKVRVHFEPNPIQEGQAFRQELNLQAGTLQVTTGSGATIRLWVDAHHPVIHITAESATPLEATAEVQLWRTNRQELEALEISDVMMNPKAPGKKQGSTFIEPDTVLTGQPNRIGWYHHNIKSVGPSIMAEIQGLTGYQQPDPLLHRTFGAMVTAKNGERLDNLRLRSPKGTSHQFSVFVLTRHPATPESWLADLDATIRQVESKPFEARRQAHVQWWTEFWDRSWIHATANTNAKPTLAALAPANRHPARIGSDQGGGNLFAGEVGRVSVFNQTLADSEIQALARTDHLPLPSQPGLVFSGNKPGTVGNSADWNLAAGFTIEAWVKPEKLGGGGARILDKITPGGSDGFLLDTFPGNSLRFICGQTTLQHQDSLPAGRWTHVAAVADAAAGKCRLFVNGKRVEGASGNPIGDEAAYVSWMYQLQRYITACAGRGAYPIKFNGSLFTVPPGPTEKDPDYRRWGPGYWWQNTRLPYISLCTSGDFDLQAPLFRMYATELLPLAKYRTQHYFGHGGAYYPECIMFWGAVFSETYGWTPFEQRQDKLQESGWHKWEWVGGLELCWMMLDYYDHTLDREFLNQTALPFSREILAFFEQHYPTNAQGQLVMHPSQALETWWHCTNAMPELAGCMAVSDRLLSLPAEIGAGADRELWQRLRAKLPPIPLREVNGKKALAPAAFYANKSNIENPELYPVFPFRLFAFNRPNPDWALTALEHRWDRGNNGWRQDDIFMAYLGLTADARQSLVSRARSHDPGERFPAFWGPNFDWTPDQDHGGVLMKTLQAMLLQTDGDRIFLLPAWPREWDVEFKLHAPRQTIVEGVFRNGKWESLRVTPETRRADVILGQTDLQPGPVDAAGRPKIIKLGTIDCDLVETTPIVFNGRVYRCEWVRTTYTRNSLKQDHIRLVDHETGEATAPFGQGYMFASAFAENNTVYVTGTRKSDQGDHIKMFASSDLKTWDSWVVFEQPGYGIFNTSLCKAPGGYVLMFEIDKPVEEAGIAFTARFLRSKDLRQWQLTPPACNYAKDRYTAPHCLRYLDGWFYDFYLEAHQGYEMRVVRSRDLIHWIPSPLNPVLRASEDDRKIANPKLTPAERQRVATAANLNNSDIDFCEFNGRLIINYSWGNQLGVEHLAEALYEGTENQFLRGWYPEQGGGKQQ